MTLSVLAADGVIFIGRPVPSRPELSAVSPDLPPHSGTPAGSPETITGPPLRPQAPAGLLPLRALGAGKLPGPTEALRPQTRRRETHIQAMLSLARRRLNVLWAMLRDGTTHTPLAARLKAA